MSQIDAARIVIFVNIRVKKLVKLRKYLRIFCALRWRNQI